MLTLAFDTSSKTVSVSILRDKDILFDTLINTGLNHSEVLLPAIDNACCQVGVKVNEIDLFACTLGPGSFTGLRIGVSTLQGLMMSTGKPAVGVSSLAALALNVDQKEKIIGSMMDAGRGQVYLAYYRCNEDDILSQLEAERALNPQSIIDNYKDEIIYVGDGAIKYADIIGGITDKKNKIASDKQQFICASNVGILARKKYYTNDLMDLESCIPVYLRSADALLKKPIFF